MVKGLTNRQSLDKVIPVEMVLELLSFSGGENTIGSQQELQNNEARTIKNWDSTSIGGMIRSKGFTEVADGGATYTDDMDLVAHHWEGANTETYGIIEGALVIKSSADLNSEDAAAFTSGTLSHAVSAGDKLWITNVDDNLQQKEIGVAIASPTTEPTNPCARIYEHASVFRLIAEGDSANTVYGTKPGTGTTWSGAGGWTTANSAWSMVMPDVTKGCMPGFPSGTDLTVFTEFDAYIIYNQPNVARRRIANGIGCGAPLSIVRGNEGVFFFSTYPTRGIFLWTGVEFINLTEKADFIDNVNLSQRIFGTYRDRSYYFIYNETGSGVTYPNRIKKYDTRFGKWWERSINVALADSLGYPSLQTRDNNELYIGSSVKDKLYELDDSSTSDAGQDTEAVYTTKKFTSRDFNVGSGGGFPIDGVKMKLTKIIVTYKGDVGNISVSWDADAGLHTGQQTFGLSTGVGDLINTTFTVNSSNILGEPSVKNSIKTFNNSAVGKEFEFQILNNGTGTRPEIKRIKIYANALEEL